VVFFKDKITNPKKTKKSVAPQSCTTENAENTEEKQYIIEKAKIFILKIILFCIFLLFSVISVHSVVEFMNI